MARRTRKDPNILRQKAEELERQRRELLAAATALDKEREQREEARAGVKFRKLWRHWHQGVNHEEVRRTLFDVFGEPPPPQKRSNEAVASPGKDGQKTSQGEDSEAAAGEASPGTREAGSAVGSPPLFRVGTGTK